MYLVKMPGWRRLEIQQRKLKYCFKNKYGKINIKAALAYMDHRSETSKYLYTICVYTKYTIVCKQTSIHKY